MYVLPDASALSAAVVVASVVICDAVVATVVFSTTAVSAWFVLSLLDLLNSLIWILALSSFLLLV